MCLDIVYLSYCPCPFIRDLSSSRAVRRRFVVLSPLCFLVRVFILTVPQTVQRCRMQKGYKVGVLFPARADFDNGFYKVPWEDGLGSGFKK